MRVLLSVASPCYKSLLAMGHPSQKNMAEVSSLLRKVFCWPGRSIPRNFSGDATDKTTLMDSQLNLCYHSKRMTRDRRTMMAALPEAGDVASLGKLKASLAWSLVLKSLPPSQRLMMWPLQPSRRPKTLCLLTPVRMSSLYFLSPVRTSFSTYWPQWRHWYCLLTPVRTSSLHLLTLSET